MIWPCSASARLAHGAGSLQIISMYFTVTPLLAYGRRHLGRSPTTTHGGPAIDIRPAERRRISAGRRQVFGGGGHPEHRGVGEVAADDHHPDRQGSGRLA